MSAAYSASVLVRTIYDPGNRAVAIVGGILGFCLGLNNLLYDPGTERWPWLAAFLASDLVRIIYDAGNRAVAMVGGVLGFCLGENSL